MVQHITFVPNATATEPEPDPPIATLWRDDQTLKWGLADGYSWPNREGEQEVPIKFLAAVGDYLAWPGDVPTPIGDRPDPPLADRRFYVASANKVLAPGETLVIEKYHYMFVVCPVDHPDCPVTFDPHLTRAPQNQQWWDDGEGVWHDPEVENRNQP